MRGSEGLGEEIAARLVEVLKPRTGATVLRGLGLNPGCGLDLLVVFGFFVMGNQKVAVRFHRPGYGKQDETRRAGTVPAWNRFEGLPRRDSVL